MKQATKLVLGLVVIMLIGGCSDVAMAQGMDRGELEAHLKPYFNQVVDAIYIAEGGKKAKKPYGILSVPCKDKADCRSVCYNTVRNSYWRWIEAGRPNDYIDFLGNRYCPTTGNISELERKLNGNWKQNVRMLLLQ